MAWTGKGGGGRFGKWSVHMVLASLALQPGMLRQRLSREGRWGERQLSKPLLLQLGLHVSSRNEVVRGWKGEWHLGAPNQPSPAEWTGLFHSGPAVTHSQCCWLWHEHFFNMLHQTAVTEWRAGMQTCCLQIINGQQGSVE